MLIWTFLLRRYREWRSFNQTYDALRRLDHRMLADLDIRPDDIRTVARDAARRGVS